MEFVDGRPIETLSERPQPERDAAAGLLVALVLRELFNGGIMQTDPNFANYRWQTETGRLVLLDFGAAREVRPETRIGYHRLLMACLDDSRDAVREAALAAGFLGQAAIARHAGSVDRMIDIVLAELARPGEFDFGDRAFLVALREEAKGVAEDRATWHLPPVDTLFVQRKVSGTALLCARLAAKADLRSMIETHRDWRPPDKVSSA